VTACSGLQLGGLLLREVEVRPRIIGDVRVRDAKIAEIGTALAGHGEHVVSGAGGALLPGLHDHHCHLLATAAAARSVLCGPPEVTTRAGLEAALRAAGQSGVASNGGWVRGVGYDDAVAGPLDSAALDQLAGDVPVRVQHRSGALWMLNSHALKALDIDRARLDGIERDGAGRPTGRLWRLDHWLQQRLAQTSASGPASPPAPDLATVGRRLASYGVTGVTDATADLPDRSLDVLTSACRSGSLPQRVLLLGAGARHLPPGLESGPRKIVLPDHDLPGFDWLAAAVAAARRDDQAVAVHCVTRESLLLALAVLDETGTRPGDRIEHAAVAPPEAVEAMARAGLAVVTQPSLLARRGDDYLNRVEAEDVPCLWRYRSFLTAGLPVGNSSDAPYGDLDPWGSIAAAMSRTTPSGRVVGPAERVTARQALAGYLSGSRSPGGPVRTIDVGASADLVLLRDPLAEALTDPRHDRVRLTVTRGVVTYDAAA
jgi:predicted amidohydrolase YtcJ